MSRVSSLSHNIDRPSLIDLGRQLPFYIDDRLKKELCFAETLIISCAHYEGYVRRDKGRSGHDQKPGRDPDHDHRRDEIGADGGEESEEFTLTESLPTEVSEDVKQEPHEIKDFEPEPEPEESVEEDDDFHFYFFPDCKKPAPKESRESCILVDGVPKVNEAAKPPKFCTCDKTKKDKCTCHAIMPCFCGAKRKEECTCAQLKEICICDERKPNIICVCGKKDKICTCFPGPPMPFCVCEEVEKPCICQKGKYPYPVCTCKYKPKFTPESVSSLDWEGGEYHLTEIVEESVASGEGTTPKSEMIFPKKFLEEDEGEREPCDCQKPEHKPHCLCLIGKKCTCLQDACICGVQKTCVCEPAEDKEPQPVCLSDSSDSKTICDCPIPRLCTCDAKEDDCKCFPKKRFCTCGDPENCKCMKLCDCADPCICDINNTKDECICDDRKKQLENKLVCTCPCKEKDVNKLKKVRAGKEGYRWCKDVDPYHTFFDYAYGRHDLIDYKEQEKEKFKILGLYDEENEEPCPIHGPERASFEKKVRKPSLDCCSAVGGITVSVEALGEECDKFLVQVVSHSSKEGAKTGSKLVSIVDLNLHTLEENRNEHISKKDKTKEYKSYISVCDTGYYNKVTRRCGTRSVVKRLYHNFEKARNFLLEGASVVLLRYFGLRRYKGTVQTVSILIDGTICDSIYVCLGVSQAIVNGKPLFVVKVERHIIEPNGFVHQSLTVLSLRGYIISHEWADNNYVLHLNPLLNVVPEKDEIEQHAPLRERWREDLQLLSDYLDHKTTRSSEGARYIAESGMLTATVKDFLQTILLLKPSDVMHFTRHYFDSAMSALDLPRDEYFDNCAKHVRYFYFEQ